MEYSVKSSAIACLLSLLPLTASLVVPSTPCPDVFHYEKDDSGTWYGMIRVPASSGLPLRLITEIYLRAVLPTKYSGRLELLLGKDEVFRQLRAGILKYVDYRLRFPLQHTIPEIKRITVNKIILCEGPPVMSHVLTTITLEHSLYPLNVYRPGQVQPEPEVPFSSPEPMFPKDPNIFPIESQHETNPSPPSEEKNPSVFLINPENPFLSQGFGTKKPVTVPTVQPEKPSISKPQTVPKPSLPPPQGTNVNFADIDTSDLCGRAVVPNELVLNGQRTARGEWPWIAAIFTVTNIGQDFTCSGNLVNKRTVITAAHCIKYREQPALKPSDLVVYLGKYQVRRFAEPYSQACEVESIHLHPDYNSNNFDADIAVLILKRPVEYSVYIIPICLWTQDNSLDKVVGQVGVVVGWGRDENGNKVTDEPRKTTVPIVSREDCINSRKDFALITSDRSICAGYRNDSGPCSGDSGGGLFLPATISNDERPRWHLRGIVSLSLLDTETQRCDLKQYVVFTDVAKFQDWVLDIINKTKEMFPT